MTEAFSIPDMIAPASPPAGLMPLTALAAAGPVGEELVAHRGARSCSRFSDPAGELSALVEAAGVFDQGARVRLRVSGDDRVRWLNGMVTNNIKELAAGRHNYNFVLNAQGRIQGDGTVFAFADHLLLETDRAQAERLFTHLDRFIIMDDVELDWLEGETSIGLAGPGAADLLVALGLPAPATGAFAGSGNVRVVAEHSVYVPRYSVWVEQAGAGELWERLRRAGGVPAGVYAVEMLRIGEGLPLYGADMTDRSLAQETGQGQALNFSKGCYLGQEIVERIRSQARVHRGLRVYWLDGEAAPGMPLAFEDKKAGELTSVAESLTGAGGPRRAMASVRLELAEGCAELTYEGGTARAVRLPCFRLA